MMRRIGILPQDSGDAGVTWLTPRAVALLVVCQHGSRTVWTLSRALGVTRLALLAIASQVADLGLVTVPQGKLDGDTTVQLTDEGRDWLVRSRCAL